MSVYINLCPGEVSIISMDLYFRSKKNIVVHIAERHRRRPGFDGIMPEYFDFFEIVFEPLKKKYKKC